MFSFLSPLFLVGALSALIPLLIHLSRSKRTKKMRFSTTRFFTDQFLRSYRMSRVKEMLLLLCRMAACALLAMAFAHPLFQDKGKTFSGGNRDVVLVMDDSASMGYVEDGVTQLDRARNAARDVIGGLGNGDRATVVLAGRRANGPEVVFREPNAQLGDVIQAVNAVQPTSLGTDLTAAIAEGRKVLAHSEASSKEIYVLSDMQETGWDRSDASAPTQETDVLHFFVRTRPQHVANLAVVAVQHGSARPTVGVPFPIQPVIVGQGDTSTKVNVRLFVDDVKAGEHVVQRQPKGNWIVPRFYHRFAKPGWHSGYVEMDDDALGADNRRYFAFDVVDSIPVLAIDGAPSQVARLDELYFLKAALGAAGEGKGAIQLDVKTPAELSTVDLKKFPLVVLANVAKLTGPTVEKLETYADQGGSVLVFLGDEVSAPFYNAQFSDPSRLHGGLLPGKLAGIQGNPAGDAAFANFGRVEVEHPALNIFKEPALRSILDKVTVKALWKLEPTDGAIVLARTSKDDLPLLVEKTFGKGRVVLFTSTCDKDWTSFPTSFAYPLFLHGQVGYLAQQPLGRQGFTYAGETVPIPISATQGLTQVVIEKPDKSRVPAVETGNPEFPLAFNDTSKAGIYTIIAADKKDSNALFAVNMESYESKLDGVDENFVEPDEAAATRDSKIAGGLASMLHLPPQFVVYVNEPTDVGNAALNAGRGKQFWEYLLYFVLVLALFEPWLANQISMRLYAKPAEVAGSTGRAGVVNPLAATRPAAPVREEVAQS